MVTSYYSNPSQWLLATQVTSYYGNHTIHQAVTVVTTLHIAIIRVYSQ